MRFAVVFLLLSGCGARPSPEPPPGERLACALAGAEAFADTCTLIRSSRAGGELLTLVAPDGGFRRIAVEADEFVAADGAEPARVIEEGGTVELSIGRDRYRFRASAP